MKFFGEKFRIRKPRINKDKPRQMKLLRESEKHYQSYEYYKAKSDCPKGQRRELVRSCFFQIDTFRASSSMSTPENDFYGLT